MKIWDFLNLFSRFGEFSPLLIYDIVCVCVYVCLYIYVRVWRWKDHKLRFYSNIIIQHTSRSQFVNLIYARLYIVHLN